MKNVGEREAMLLGQRDVQAVICGRGLQFKIKTAAEALPQRQSPCLVDSSTERRVDHQLHSTAFIEETFGDDRLLRGHGSEHGASLQNVFDHLLGARVVEAA